MVQQKELSLGRGGKDIQVPSPVPGSRVTLPESETLPIDSKDSGVWRSAACRSYFRISRLAVVFQFREAMSPASSLLAPRF